MRSNRDISAHLSADVVHGDEELHLMASAARLFYDERLTHVQIAQRLGVSRFKVARLIDRSREVGIVTITINDFGLTELRLAAEVADALSIRACHVIPTSDSAKEARRDVGAAAAALLTSTLVEGEVLGLSWGRTLTATVSNLPSPRC